MQFKNYRKAVEYLIHEIPKTARQVFDDDLTLQKNRQLMQMLGNPQEKHAAIHVAGTSGKGTICYLADALLRAHSQRTGMTQSPHVYDIRERIQINGQLISEKKFVYTLKRVLDTTHANGITPSYFETLTAMGFEALSHSQVDYQVIETGFGGRLDATNVISRPDKVCIISRIGLDHTDSLGNTIEKIAAEKAGIIQAGNHVVALRQEPEVNAVFEKRCREVRATIAWVEQTGDYQKTNDLLARSACKFIAVRDGWEFDDSLADATLQQVFIPGRFEKRHFKDHLIILDGAHNPQKFSALVNRVTRENKAPATIVLALGARKDVANCIEILGLIASRIITTEFFTKLQDIPRRPVPAAELAEACRAADIEVIAERSPHTALARAAQFSEPIIVTGSFYLLGEVDPII